MSTAAPGFVWYELMTTDVPSATAFYAEVVGWRIADAGMPGMAYSYLHAGERAVGGLMALPAEAAAAGARPGWVGYIGVADVDAQAQQVVQAGGRLQPTCLVRIEHVWKRREVGREELRRRHSGDRLAVVAQELGALADGLQAHGRHGRRRSRVAASR